MKSPRSSRARCFVPLALTWSHAGIGYRVTPWPEVRFESQYGDEWIAGSPAEDALASAAQDLGDAEWAPFLEFVPAELRSWLLRFGATRMEALLVAARCPEVLSTLEDTPALTAFVASHASLRGALEPSWQEIAAVHERGGVFGVLEWLGLPASRQTLAILGNIAQPDVPKRFLEPLRRLLWQPTATFALQRMPEITDQALATTCHALAA